MSGRAPRQIPRPFLKWVGGKGQLLRELLKRIDELDSFGRYLEPMMGGAALFFELRRTGRLGRKHPYLSDTNKNLVNAFEGLRTDVDAVMERLRAHQTRHCEEYYYEVRAQEPTDLVEHTARVIYLNKTGYNGLYRENSRGKFNVPFGRYANPTICDEHNLPAAAEALQRVTIEHRSFEHVSKVARKGDLVYFDPPYVPLTKTANFTSYSKSGFGMKEQERLAEVFAELAGRGVHVLLSNSYTEPVRELYARFTIEPVDASRAVNSRADRRGKVKEALVRSF